MKRLQSLEKRSTLCVLAISSENGLRCFDTSVSPPKVTSIVLIGSYPKVILNNSVPDIVYCGTDLGRPEYITCIVRNPGPDPFFPCHVFKCQNKDAVSWAWRSLLTVQAADVARAVVGACTAAFQVGNTVVLLLKA
jgi:hypothetical protein